MQKLDTSQLPLEKFVVLLFGIPSNFGIHLFSL